MGRPRTWRGPHWQEIYQGSLTGDREEVLEKCLDDEGILEQWEDLQQTERVSGEISIKQESPSAVNTKSKLRK